MNYQEFLENLQSFGFSVKGKSFAFKQFEDWEISFIRMGGKYQSPGNITFVICARPKSFKGLEGKILNESKEPHDYPFKLIPNEIDEAINYESKLLNYKLQDMKVDADWSKIYEILTSYLPDKLFRLGVLGLKKQLRELKNPGYIEKIWLDENVSD